MYETERNIVITFASRLKREKTERIRAMGIMIHFDTYGHDSTAQASKRVSAASIKSGLALANPCCGFFVNLPCTLEWTPLL